MKSKLITLSLLLISFIANSQKTPDSTLTLDSNIVDIYLHNTTGISVTTTNGAVYGIDGEKGEKIWEFKESGFIKNLNALGQEGGSSFEEIPLSPFGKFNETIFNIKTGNKIISKENDGFKKIINSQYVLGKKAILFTAKTQEKNKAKIFLISAVDDTVLWKKTIETSKKIGGSIIQHYIQNDSQVAFSLAETIFLVNKNDGNVILSEKYNSGKLFFTENNNSLIAVENKGGSLIGGAIKAGLTAGLSLIGKKVIGKELQAFDTSSGNKVWKKPIKLNEGFVDYQFEDGNLFIINKDGGNLYDYNTGKELWKKEFGKKKIKEIEKTSEGYIVYYKNKKHLLDNSGKKVWKKSQKVIQNVDFEVGDEEEFTSIEYTKGIIFITPHRLEYFEKGKEKRVYKIGLDENDDKLVFDEKHNNLILLSGKKLYVLNPDKNLGKDEVKKIAFNDHKTISTLEVRGNTYFMNSNWEYALTDLEGNTIKKEYFKQPGEGLRHLKNIGSFAAGIGGAGLKVSGVANGATGATLYGAGTFVDNQNAIDQGNKQLKKGSNQINQGLALEEIGNLLWDGERHSAFTETKDNAFFFTKKDDKKVLLQVNKDSGDIIDSYEFSVNKPKYIIDKIEKRIYFRKGKDLKIFSYN